MSNDDTMYRLHDGTKLHDLFVAFQMIPETPGQRYGQAFYDFVRPELSEEPTDKIWWDRLYNEPVRQKAMAMINDKCWGF